MCRVGTVEKFDEQISALRTSAEIAEKEWLAEKDLRRKADLEKAWKQALEREERLLRLSCWREGGLWRPSCGKQVSAAAASKVSTAPGSVAFADRSLLINDYQTGNSASLLKFISLA